MLAVFQVSETEDRCVALSRLFCPTKPAQRRTFRAAHCFVRFALECRSPAAAGQPANLLNGGSPPRKRNHHDAGSPITRPRRIPEIVLPRKPATPARRKMEPPPLPAGSRRN
jgi:hypothetical protein